MKEYGLEGEKLEVILNKLHFVETVLGAYQEKLISKGKQPVSITGKELLAFYLTDNRLKEGL